MSSSSSPCRAQPSVRCAALCERQIPPLRVRDCADPVRLSLPSEPQYGSDQDRPPPRTRLDVCGPCSRLCKLCFLGKRGQGIFPALESSRNGTAIVSGIMRSYRPAPTCPRPSRRSSCWRTPSGRMTFPESSSACTVGGAALPSSPPRSGTARKATSWLVFVSRAPPVISPLSLMSPAYTRGNEPGGTRELRSVILPFCQMSDERYNLQ